MQLLSIGNSFSQDAHKWLCDLAECNGVSLETANLFIGGCSLQTHWENVKENKADYDLELNGNAPERRISIKEALELKKWDIITLQQASHYSGKYETYEPYLSSLVSVIKESQPQAKIYFHQTWAYETDFDYITFANYDNDQNKMYRCIEEVSKKVAESIGVTIIPSGRVIQTIRETVPEFDYAKGGLSLCRDGLHLSLDYGRFAVAAIWLHTITGQEIEIDGFENFNPLLVKKILKVVNEL